MATQPRHCAWLFEDGNICDAVLAADQIFCGHHPAGPRRRPAVVDERGEDPFMTGAPYGRTRPSKFTVPPDVRPVPPDWTTQVAPGAVPSGTVAPTVDPVVDQTLLRPAVIDHPPTARRPRGELEASYHEALGTVGQQTTPDGLLVCYLARQLDDGPTPSAIATIAARLMMAAEKVFAGRPPTVDALDELNERRRHRRAVNDD